MGWEKKLTVLHGIMLHVIHRRLLPRARRRGDGVYWPHRRCEHVVEEEAPYDNGEEPEGSDWPCDGHFPKCKPGVNGRRRKREDILGVLTLDGVELLVVSHTKLMSGMGTLRAILLLR